MWFRGGRGTDRGGKSGRGRFPLAAHNQGPAIPVCQYFLHGNCAFGNRCRFLHPTPSQFQHSVERSISAPAPRAWISCPDLKSNRGFSSVDSSFTILSYNILSPSCLTRRVFCVLARFALISLSSSTWIVSFFFQHPCILTVRGRTCRSTVAACAFLLSWRRYGLTLQLFRFV